MVKNEKFLHPSETGGPEDFKNHTTSVPSAIFGGVMASQNMVNFFLGHPVSLKFIKMNGSMIFFFLTFHLFLIKYSNFFLILTTIFLSVGYYERPRNIPSISLALEVVMATFLLSSWISASLSLWIESSQTT